MNLNLTRMFPVQSVQAEFSSAPVISKCDGAIACADKHVQGMSVKLRDAEGATLLQKACSSATCQSNVSAVPYDAMWCHVMPCGYATRKSAWNLRDSRSSSWGNPQWTHSHIETDHREGRQLERQGWSIQLMNPEQIQVSIGVNALLIVASDSGGNVLHFYAFISFYFILFHFISHYFQCFAAGELMSFRSARVLMDTLRCTKLVTLDMKMQGFQDQLAAGQPEDCWRRNLWSFKKSFMIFYGLLKSSMPFWM